jgi:hypothetical protein
MNYLRNALFSIVCILFVFSNHFDMILGSIGATTRRARDIIIFCMCN